MNKETKNNITLSFSQKVHTKTNDPSTASPQNVRIMETWLKRSVLFILVTMYLASTLPFQILIIWYLKWNKKNIKLLTMWMLLPIWYYLLPMSLPMLLPTLISVTYVYYFLCELSLILCESSFFANVLNL